MKIYNNDFFLTTAIYLVLCERVEWSLSEMALILPIISNAGLINTIKRKKSYVSFFDIVIDKPELFYNFSQMHNTYKSNLINCIILLENVGALSIDKVTNTLEIIVKPEIHEKITAIVIQDQRLVNIDAVSGKIADMIKDKINIVELYSQLGVNL